MNRRQVVSRMDLQAIEAKIQILERMVEIFKENKYTMLNIKCDSIMIVSLIFKVLTRDEHSISDQEIDDVTMELQRLSRCVQFEVIMISPGYVSITHKPEVQQIRDAIKKSINNIARWVFSLPSFIELFCLRKIRFLAVGHCFFKLLEMFIMLLSSVNSVEISKIYCLTN